MQLAEVGRLCICVYKLKQNYIVMCRVKLKKQSPIVVEKQTGRSVVPF